MTSSSFRTRSGRTLARAAILLAVGMLVVGQRSGRTACNVIPSAERVFASTLGTVDRPFAAGGDEVVITRDAPVFAREPSANRVIVRMASTSAARRKVRVEEVLAPAAESACTPADCVDDRCRCIRFRFPGAEGRDPATGDASHLTGPVEIRVRTGGVTTAVVDTLRVGFAGGSPVADPVFSHFVALPRATDVASLAAVGGDILAASDAAGNLLIPFDFSGSVSRERSLTQFLEARLGAPVLSGETEIDSFTPTGQRLPPLLRVTGESTLIGTVDAPASVLRIAGGVRLAGAGPSDPGGSIVLPSVSVAADPVNVADPLTLVERENFAVYEARECETAVRCADLNGDGDTRDYRLLALDLTVPGAVPLLIDEVDAGSFVGVDLADPPPGLYTFESSDQLVTYQIAEAFSIDLNGDGDREDLVRSGAFDLTRGARIAAADDAQRLEIAGGLLAFSVPAAPGSQVGLLAVYDAEAPSARATLVGDDTHAYFLIAPPPVVGPNVTVPFDVAVGGRRVAFVVGEGLQGEDLTHDGDLLDFAVLTFDADAGTVQNLELASSRALHLESGLLAVNVPTGDGGTAVALVAPEASPDPLFTICDEPGASGSILANASPNLLPCVVREAARDLNGDGDTDDFVLRVLAADSPFGLVEFDLEVAVASLFDAQTSGATMVVAVSEALQGADLDGDGRVEPELGPFGPFVLLHFHAPTAILQSLGVDALQGFPPFAGFVDGGFGFLEAADDPGNTRRVFLRDLDADGLFEDFVRVDPVSERPVPLDNCPTVFNPLQQDRDGDAVGDACDPPTAARGGTPDVACVVQMSVGAPMSSPDVYTCRDGDRRCDLDQRPGRCVVGVSVCLLVADERFPECVPEQRSVERVHVRVTAPDRGPGAADPATATRILEALAGERGTLDDRGASFEPPLTVDAPGRPTCTQAIPVPLRLHAGSSRGRRSVRVTAELTDDDVRARAQGAVSIVCLPAE